MPFAEDVNKDGRGVMGLEMAIRTGACVGDQLENFGFIPLIGCCIKRLSLPSIIMLTLAILLSGGGPTYDKHSWMEIFAGRDQTELPLDVMLITVKQLVWCLLASSDQGQMPLIFLFKDH